MKITKLLSSLILIMSFAIGLFRPIAVSAEASPYEVYELVHAFNGAVLDDASISDLQGVWSDFDDDIVSKAIAAGYVSAGATISTVDSIIQTVFEDCNNGVVNELTAFLHNLGCQFMFSLGTLGTLATDGIPGAYRFGAYSEYMTADPSIRQQYSVSDCIKMAWNSYRSRYCRPEEFENLSILRKAAINIATDLNLAADIIADSINPANYTERHVIEYDQDVVSALGILFTSDPGNYFLDDIYIPQNQIDESVGELPAYYVGSADFQYIDTMLDYWSAAVGPVSSDSWDASLYNSAYTIGTIKNYASSLSVQNSYPSIPDGTYIVTQRLYRQNTPSVNTYNKYDYYSFQRVLNPVYCYVTTRNGVDIATFSTVDPQNVTSWSDVSYSTYGTRIDLGSNAPSWIYQYYYKSADYIQDSDDDYVHSDITYSAGQVSPSQVRYFPEVTYYSGESSFGLYGYDSGVKKAIPGTSARHYYTKDLGFSIYDNSVWGPNLFCYQYNNSEYDSVDIERRIIYSSSPIPIYRVESGSADPDPVEITSPWTVNPINITGGDVSIDVTVLSPSSDPVNIGIKISLPGVTYSPDQVDNYADFINPILNYYIDLDINAPITYNDIVTNNLTYSSDGSGGSGGGGDDDPGHTGHWWDRWWNPVSIMWDFPWRKITNPLKVDDYTPVYPDTPSQISEFISQIPGTSSNPQSSSWYQWIADMMDVLPDQLMNTIWIVVGIGALVAIFFKIE